MTETTPKAKVRVATVWLDGCSGCHMSFLDMDERLLELAAHIDIVYSPLVDFKTFPPNVDVTLVEGAVSNEDDLHKIQLVRANTKILIALGDCAVTGNVPSLRNPLGPKAVLNHAYPKGTVFEVVPPLLKMVRPVHAVVKVDVYVPGCPPPADLIHFAVTELLAGRTPDLSNVARFGL